MIGGNSHAEAQRRKKTETLMGANWFAASAEEERRGGLEFGNAKELTCAAFPIGANATGSA
jgi:hypothetical protein